MMKTLLQSLSDEVTALIRRTEENYSDLVIADFNEALERSRNPIKTANHWLHTLHKWKGEKYDTEKTR
jgi:hypothetical protein